MMCDCRPPKALFITLNVDTQYVFTAYLTPVLIFYESKHVCKNAGACTLFAFCVVVSVEASKDEVGASIQASIEVMEASTEASYMEVQMSVKASTEAVEGFTQAFMEASHGIFRIFCKLFYYFI